MKQEFKKGTIIDFEDDKWTIDFKASGIADKLLLEGRLLHISNDNKSVIDILLFDESLVVNVLFDSRSMPIVLKANISNGDEVIISNSFYKISLYVNGVLCDEDWPIGRVNLKNAVCDFCDISTVVITDYDYVEEGAKENIIKF